MMRNRATVILTALHTPDGNVPPLYVIGTLPPGLYPLSSTREYILPPGYSINTDMRGDPWILDHEGRRCLIVQHPSGHPQIVTAWQAAILDVA
jgi:hypothetical protein